MAEAVPSHHDPIIFADFVNTQTPNSVMIENAKLVAQMSQHFEGGEDAAFREAGQRDE